MIRKVFLVISTSLLFLPGCNEKPTAPVSMDQDEIIGSETEVNDPENEDAGIIISEDSILGFTHKVLYTDHLGKKQWCEGTHNQFVYICATKLNIPQSRAVIMRDASHMPDVFQSGIDNAYNQQWSHAYILTKTWWGAQWLWGDADDDFHDNINGYSGEMESPEGYNGKWAGYYYSINSQALGDWYLGYACHYIADVSFVLHSTFPDLNMAIHHTDFEKWVENNWTTGYNLSSYANAVPASSYYTISDLKSAIRSAAKGSNSSYSSNASNAWKYYKSSNYPTSSGSGNSTLAYYVSKMVEEATKWTGGAIKYTLDRYSQW